MCLAPISLVESLEYRPRWTLDQSAPDQHDEDQLECHTDMFNCDNLSSLPINGFVYSSKTATAQFLQYRILIRHRSFCSHVAYIAEQEQCGLGVRQAKSTGRSKRSIVNDRLRGCDWGGGYRCFWYNSVVGSQCKQTSLGHMVEFTLWKSKPKLRSW